MKGILYILAIVLIIGWSIGYLVFNAGGVIHILLVLAVIAVLSVIIEDSSKY